jgi:hypothetical protein
VALIVEYTAHGVEMLFVRQMKRRGTTPEAHAAN